MANLILAAKRYAEADKSDPFAFNRAMTHLKNGVASYANQDGQAAYYDAQEDNIGGKIVYRNIIRP